MIMAIAHTLRIVLNLHFSEMKLGCLREVQTGTDEGNEVKTGTYLTAEVDLFVRCAEALVYICTAKFFLKIF